tara:strand:+ start:25 stop:597 length:573 start_codon:yes stop_codon:yes gene_type:complete
MKFLTTIINLGRVGPLFYILGPLFTILLTQKIKYILIIIGLIVNQLINEGIKRIIKAPRPSNKGTLKNIDTGCDLFPNCNHKHKHNTYGMPSGHAQVSGYIAMLYTLDILYSNIITNPTSKYISISILWLISIFICWTRFYIKCHSIPQLCVGVLLGGIVGLLSYILFYKLYPNDWPIIDSKNNILLKYT